MKKNEFYQGMIDAIPIGLGYLAVSFSLGILMRNNGISPFQGFLMSLLNNASAGEYAITNAIGQSAKYLGIVIVTIIANARYFLMSFSLSQKFDKDTPLWKRAIIGFDLTDELFGLAINYEGYLKPSYYFGAMTSSIPCWAIGTSLGIIFGNILPGSIVYALSVALFGMFLAIIIPPCQENKNLLIVILISFILSGLCLLIPSINSSNLKLIILTIVISIIAAIIKPIEESHE